MSSLSILLRFLLQYDRIEGLMFVFLIALSVLEGTTLMDNNTVIGGNWTIGLDRPRGITVFGTDTDSLIIADLWHHRVLGFWNVGTNYQNITVVATEWAPGKPLCLPYDMYIDLRHGYDMYLSDYCTSQVILYTNMQTVNPLPRVVAGTFNNTGLGLHVLNVPYGIYVDSRRNVIVVSKDQHRIMFWPPNSTNGTVIAGLSAPSNTSMGLYDPSGIVVDEDTWFLYVADANNHRIQRFSLNDTWPCNGTTVAGGNGPGIGRHQLNYPTHVTISKKTKALYIVDYGNHRIQRWQQGATQGFTIAGDPNGNPGSNPTQLRYPIGMALNTNETHIYVTDRFNYRIQRFQII